MDWKTANGWLVDEEREELYRLAQSVSEDGLILNVGVEYGASLVCLRSGSKARIIAVDIKRYQLVKGLEPIEYMILPSRDALIVLERRGLKFDLAFIDGGHSYLDVLGDTGFARMLKDNGIIAFHDCYRYGGPPGTKADTAAVGVNEAVEKWLKTTELRVKELKPSASTRIFKVLAA